MNFTVQGGLPSNRNKGKILGGEEKYYNACVQMMAHLLVRIPKETDSRCFIWVLQTQESKDEGKVNVTIRDLKHKITWCFTILATASQWAQQGRDDTGHLEGAAAQDTRGSSLHGGTWKTDELK